MSRWQVSAHATELRAYDHIVPPAAKDYQQGSEFCGLMEDPLEA